jgi:enediyne biosynthesis protein E4
MYCQHPSRCPQFFESFEFSETSVPAGPHLRASVRAIFFFLTLVFLGCRRPETPLFTRLPPAETGISFANTIVENDSLNVLKFEYIYNGAGVGVGDFDADGLPDLFFAGNRVPGVLYLNRGRFKFEDVTRASGIETPYWSTGVAVADVNDDGLPDVYLSTAHPDRRRSSPNQLFVNQGVQDGVPRFKELAATVGLADSSYATQAAFLDYDLDGDLDLYLLCNALEDYNRNNVRPKVTDGTARSNDRLYRNEGSQADGLPRFKDVSREAGINIEGWGLGVGVSDFNADGWPDIYCANDFLSNDLMWINNRDGTFSNRIGEYLKHQSHNSMGMDIADINNDERPEIITLDMMPDDNRRQKSMFPAPNYNKYKLDIALGYQPQFVRNMLQLNQGETFSEIGQMAGVYATDWSWSALMADLDHDGFRDIWITNGYKKDVTDLDFVSYQQDHAMFGTDATRKTRTAEQFDKMIGVKKSNFVFRNKGDLTFEDRTKAWGLEIPSYSNGAVYADFDLDGDLDLASNNLEDPALVYRNNLIESGRPDARYLRIRLKGAAGNRAALGAKTTLWLQDGRRLFAENYCIRGYKSSVEPVLHFGLGSATKVDSVTVQWPGGKRSVRAQVAADQVITIDIKEATGAWNRGASLRPLFLELAKNDVAGNHLENDFIDFALQPLLPHQFSAAGPPLAVADVNGDGLEDFFMGSASSFNGKLFLQTASGRFAARDFPKKNLLCEETAAVFFDADGDSDADLYVVGGGYEWPKEHPAYQDQLYLNNGAGVFGAAEGVLPLTVAAGACVAAADYDGDGDTDLFVGGRVVPGEYPRPARSYVLRNETRSGAFRFSDATPDVLENPGMVSSAVWADFDGDRRPDLALAGEFMAVQVYSNKNGAFQRAVCPELDAKTGWWNSMIAADFDGDGDLDLAAGNLGLNTRYQASAKEPVTLYAHDFDQNGTIDPFLCRYIGGKEYLTHPRDAVTAQVPGLKRRFLKYADYGQKTVHDVFRKQELQDATVLKAVEMRSCYFENTGNNHFRIKALQNIAQIAPVNALLAEDFDGDGHLDLALVGNNYAAEVQTGRYDAFKGLILTGDGKGQFQPLSLEKSGFRTDLDARSLVKVRGKKRDVFVVGNNNGGVQGFELKRPPDNQ